MSALLALFLNNLLPIFLSAGAGYVLSRLMNLNPRTLAQVIFYIFSPCLIFNLITHNQLGNGDIARMMILAALVMALVGLITWLFGRLMKLERRMMAALLLTSTFMNAGNFGLSLNLFAFGDPGLAYASLFFITSSIMNYTVGVVIASMGRASLLQALVNLVKIPAIYALVLAFLFQTTNWQLPLPLERTTTLLGDAAIPSMLVLLGLQFRSIHWAGNMAPLVMTHMMRLFIAPALAIGLSVLLGLQGTARQAGVIESAMPTAVLTTVIATEFDVEPAFVASAVFATTIFSAITLTPLLAYLGG